MRINPIRPSFKGTFQIFCDKNSEKDNTALDELVKNKKPTGYFYGNVGYISVDTERGGFERINKKEMKVSFPNNDGDEGILHFLNAKNYPYWYTNTVNEADDKFLKLHYFEMQSNEWKVDSSLNVGNDHDPRW